MKVTDILHSGYTTKHGDPLVTEMILWSIQSYGWRGDKIKLSRKTKSVVDGSRRMIALHILFLHGYDVNSLGNIFEFID